MSANIISVGTVTEVFKTDSNGHVQVTQMTNNKACGWCTWCVFRFIVVGGSSKSERPPVPCPSHGFFLTIAHDAKLVIGGAGQAAASSKQLLQRKPRSSCTRHTTKHQRLIHSARTFMPCMVAIFSDSTQLEKTMMTTDLLITCNCQTTS